MILYKKAQDLSQYLQQQKKSGHSIGFVPTMGALHKGHLSLIENCRKQNPLTICSIFVNPTQFNNPDDFAKYPVTIEKDLELLLSAGCDVVFLPSTEEIYPAGYQKKSYDLGRLETILEGRYRPGHFQGVCEVVDRLLLLVQPDKLYLGQKDYQQCMVIRKLIELTNRQKAIELIIGTTVREDDGLAMSSRNLRLTPEQRVMAGTLFQSLLFAKEHFRNKPAGQIEQEAIQLLKQENFRPDYFEIADARTLEPPSKYSSQYVALVAAYIGEVRLIDNLLLN